MTLIGGNPGAGKSAFARASAVKAKHPLTLAVSGCLAVERKGVEPSTFALRTRRPSNASDNSQALRSATSRGCTTGCTSEPKNDNATAENGAGERGDTLADLAAAVANLSPADRARLAAMLTGNAPADGSTSKAATGKPATGSTDKPATNKAKPKGKSKAKGATNGR